MLSLSNAFNVPTGELIRENNLTAEISEGDVLILSVSENAYKVKPLESAREIAEKFGLSEQDVLLKNGFPYLFYGIVVEK